MAYHHINHTCGHCGDVKITGNSDYIRKRIADLEARACNDCVAAKSDLTGSPKQIAWAEDIRAKEMARLEADLAKLIATINAQAAPAVKAWACEYATKMFDFAAQQKPARWWIDEATRYDLPRINDITKAWMDQNK